MATELLQDREGLSVSAQLGQEYLQTGIASFEEVEEIVKSNLWKISDLTHDENAQDGFPDHDDGYDDLLGMLNLQSSDLEEKDSTESNSNEKILTKDGGKNKNFSNVEVTTESSEMPQSFKDLLDDITLVINSDKNFSNNHHHVVSKTEGLQRDSKEILASVQASRTLNKESITMSSMKIPCNAECPVKGLDNYSRVLNQGNLDQTEPLSAKDVYFEKNLSDLLGGDNSEVLTTPHEHNIDQEDLLEVPESLVSMLESSLVKLSCGMSPGKLFRDMDGTVEVTADSRLANQACDDNDVTVDGEGGDSLDEISLELCQLSYDENLTCSFYEQLQLTNDNDELLEHGQRGRPSRQKVTRQAVPCKIEPKVSQMGLQPAFFPPHLFSSTFQNIPPGVTSVVPSQLQPHLGQETLRFPVLLHRDTSRPGQLYLQVCPDIAQLTPPSQASGLSSTSQGDRHSPKGNSDQSCLSSKKEVTPEKSNLGPSTDTSSYFPDDRPVVNQTNLSLEIDGPIRRQTSLNQGRHCGSRNDPYFRVTTGSSDHAVGSLLEEPYRMQTVQENQSSAMSSQNLVPAGSYQNFVPSSFVSSSQNLMRVQDASGFGGNLQHGVPYISTGVQGSLYQHNQGLPVPVTIANYGAHDQSSQFPLPTNIHHYAPGSSASSANSCSHHFSQHSNGQAMGHWTSEPNINNAAFSVSHCLGNNNPPMHTMTSGAVPYARTNSPGLPNIPADPRSLRVRMLMAMGSQGLRQVRVNSGSSDIHSTTMPQNVARFPAPNSEDNSSMIQLSPPVELRKPQFVNQQPVNAPVTAHTQSSGAAADGSVINKSVFHPKSAPSQSSTRSSKGPDLPVPVERSKARVEQWLSNLEMFRPNLDSGTFDPSDYSLVNEPSIPHAARQYPEAAGSERSLSDKSYECIGLFEGKRMTVTPPQPSPKQKGNKRTGAFNPHGKGLSLGQIGQNRYSIISDASLLTESSLNSGQTNSSKDKYADNKNDASSDCQGKSTGRRPVHAEVPISTCAKFNQEHPQIRQIPHEDLPMSTQSVSSYPANHLDENQQADLAIAEDIKQLEQKSFEKQLAGIPSSTNSGHVLNELEQFLRSDMKSSSGGTGNHQGSSFKLEAVAAGSSKPSSFDTSKYITPSDIESLEKKKTQNGKSSLDNYLPVRCFSNENMHTEQNTSNQGDGKQLMNIPLNDIDDLIGLQRELGQQPSRLGNVLPHLQFENRQKAVKRRPADHSDEAASYQMGQTAAVGGQNAAAGERNVVFSGRDVLMGGQHVVGEQKVVLGGLQQNAVMGAQSRTVGGQNATASGQNTAAYGQNTTICGQNTEVSGQNAAVGRKSVTNMMQNNKMSEMLTSVHGRTQTGKNIFAECLTMVTQNFGDQSYLVFSEQGRIHQTVVGPPSQQPDFLMKKSSTQYPNFQIPSTTPSGPTQAKPTYEPAASQTSHSGKMQPDFQLPDFSDGYYETEMHSSPSSVEILKESTPSFNNEHFTLADSAGNQLVPVSALSHTQHLMQPLSNHSVITSASVLTNTHFKKPQNPGSSSSSSSTTHRAAGPNYPSVGDSDVSMSSDTSLPNSVMLHDGSMDPKNQIDLPQLSPQQHCEQYSAQFQQINPPQPVQKMLHSTQQQVQNQKQQQLLNQQHCLQLEKNQHQKQLLLEQQNHLQMEQSQQQQQMDSQQRCLQMQTQQQITNQDYFQMLKKQQQMPNQQTLQFQTQHQMQQQHQVIRNSHHHCEKNQQKEPQQQLEEFLIQQQQPTQQMQFYQMQIQQQQQILKQGKHSQQQLTNQENQQIQNHQQHLRLQNQQHIHLQQLQMQLPETPPSNLLQNQQQMQQYQQVLNQQQYQQMQVQQLQQPQMQKQQQKQTENQQLQQQQKLYQQLQEQSLGHCSTFTTACVPQKSSGSQAGSSCSDPQSCRVLPGTKLKERSVSQISDSVYSQQLGNLSPTSENAHDLSNSIADNDLALVPQRDRHLTSSSNQSGHGKNIFNNMHTNSLSEHYQEVGLQNCSQPASGNQIPTNTLASIQQSSSHNLEIAEQDQVLKSATETQLQKYLKEGFPSLNSVEYCQDAFAVSPFLPANIPSLTPDQPQQSLAKIGQGLNSGDGSSDKSNRLHSAERSREQADSDLSVFSLGSGEDLLSFQQDNDGETPLHLLSELPKEGISSLPSMPGFYEALNLQNKNQETALDIAVKNQNLDAVRFLVSHGADVNIFCLSSQKGAGSKTVHRNETVQQTALHEAVELGNKEIVEVLLTSQNVKVDIRRPDSGLTPLMLALRLHQPHRQSDRKEIITQLINHQASLSLHDTIQGKTPLMFAIQSRDVSLVEDILQKVGAERARALLNDRAKKDMTCLHFAAELRLESSLKKRLLRCIIVAGGDPSSKNSEGETPRDWARADINEVLQNLARLYNS